MTGLWYLYNQYWPVGSRSDEDAMSSLGSFWEHFNSETSLEPLLIPSMLWVGAYVYNQTVLVPATKDSTKQDSSQPHSPSSSPKQQLRPRSFHEWTWIHNVHNFGAILAGCLSMFLQNDDRWNERIVILWSIPYFMVDLYDCILRKDGVYFLHSIACLSLGVVNYKTPLCRALRVNSKATLCELSNSFMHWAKRTKEPQPFLIFTLMFTLCRILWVPVILWQLHYSGGMAMTDPRYMGALAFYGLNWYWYVKMWMIIRNGGKRPSNKSDQTSDPDAVSSGEKRD